MNSSNQLLRTLLLFAAISLFCSHTSTNLVAQNQSNVITSPSQLQGQGTLGIPPANSLGIPNFQQQGIPAQAFQGQQYPAQQFPAQQYPAQQYPAQQQPGSTQIPQNFQNQNLTNPGLNGQAPEQIYPTLQRSNPYQQTVPVAAQAPMQIRIKDITTIEGHRSNRLTGIGLVTGLKGTGGQEELTQRLAANMLQNFDIRADEIPTGSISVVAVTAEVPPFSRPGEKITATVSTLDNASGLFGGVLQNTMLKGFDGQVYAIAGGSLVLSGFSAQGDAGTITKNHDTTGKVSAQIEVPIEEEPAFPGTSYRLLLTNKDYATAHRIAKEVNKYFPGHASALDQGTVNIYFPQQYLEAKFEFVVKINELRIVPDAPARVVINQKTGTIVVGQNVRLSRIMFANENLVITTNEAPVAAQPAPFSQGQTAILPRTELTASQTGGSYNLLEQQTTVGELAGVLNRLGVSPRDMIGIFESIKASGALQAQLIIE